MTVSRDIVWIQGSSQTNVYDYCNGRQTALVAPLIAPAGLWTMLEELFNSSVLDVVVPDTSVEYPPSADADDWLMRLKSPTAERKQAFFGVTPFVSLCLALVFTLKQMNSCLSF
jgi:hypothetical protein